MELHVATRLIGGAVGADKPETWADLGAGTGLFTKALASLMNPDGKIYAIDTDHHALAEIPASVGDTEIEKVVLDFTDAASLPSHLDGVLMANSLHFIEDKTGFIRDLKARLNASATLIIIEYDMDTPNPWVPFPISCKLLEGLLRSGGFRNVRKLHEHPSRYNRASIYSIAGSTIRQA